MKFGILTGLSAVAVVFTLMAGSVGVAQAKTNCVAASSCVSVGRTRIIGMRALVKRTKSVRIARKSGPKVLPANRQAVVALIKRMAPSYGVPTWFALRIAKVESGYNPRARGLAGEYGVFQMKCATARLVGYRGGCKGLLNASTNVQVGLKHLQLAVRSSRGNLKLAASKHNGGLGRKRLVRAYVRRVF
jgi:soluble lytic murein transglycosylase-like protein